MRDYYERPTYEEEDEMNTPFCTNNCGRRTDNEYGVCRPCVKTLCTPLDGLRQLEGYSYGDKT